jgi:pimeloyl-ACP methyl ester carboxylesterase
MSGISTLRIEPDIELRRMLLRPPTEPEGTVLFLHGFPETLYAWKGIAEALSADYEVHAFDWPGYGQSSRPDPARFPYAPRDYARILAEYIELAGIDCARLLIYATDIGSLPALLAALEQPDIARGIVVGDFAPFDRPQYMADNLRALKDGPSSETVHAAMNKGRDDILRNAYRRGLSLEEQFDLPPDVERDMEAGWDSRAITPADAFYHYYSHFTRDQDYFEANLERLTVPVTVVWGEKDFYIDKEMGIELARRGNMQLQILPGLGHYPHLQDPRRTIDEVRAAFRQPP